jgi:hypothetical protein
MGSSVIQTNKPEETASIAIIGGGPAALVLATDALTDNHASDQAKSRALAKTDPDKAVNISTTPGGKIIPHARVC